MLAHSPLLPLTIDYASNDGIAAEDEEGILFVLEQRHRVRHPPPCLSCSESSEACHGDRWGTPDPRTPDFGYFGEGHHGLRTSGNTSSTAFTSPCAEGLRLSNTISITPSC